MSAFVVYRSFQRPPSGGLFCCPSPPTWQREGLERSHLRPFAAQKGGLSPTLLSFPTLVRGQCGVSGCNDPAT